MLYKATKGLIAFTPEINCDQTVIGLPPVTSAVFLTYIDQIGNLLKRGQIKSTRNRRACMNRLMSVEEAQVVCQDRGKWRSVISAYPGRDNGVT
jgi:hypothetical protein